ncbi:MAG TPA: hypothetical protein PLO44_01755 [Candidatus Paceibacterota bacterium]|nr:hypothetical protein [Candidatus Paceibacterota bacterium]
MKFPWEKPKINRAPEKKSEEQLKTEGFWSVGDPENGIQRYVKFDKKDPFSPVEVFFVNLKTGIGTEEIEKIKPEGGNFGLSFSDEKQYSNQDSSDPNLEINRESENEGENEDSSKRYINKNSTTNKDAKKNPLLFYKKNISE